MHHTFNAELSNLKHKKMKSFLKILTMALTIISPLGNNLVSAEMNI